ncbi:LicD family protein [Thalassospira lucentensis]|uniref:LicD family protein n=1 Tax=Thalassospira lucentensis TaxID=168935 RepID=UPI0003B774A5|nr:LicD family protein [Thalassospira lucentensis]RCK18819.1 hypothetical protein TH1_22175 [Thalassospira lucentensis MCCC 1A00383 = DSM 14000]
MRNLSTDDLKSLQLVLLDMLLEVDRICRKHNIRYSLFMGTLLGAVRHNGFIPWDDDLDIAMTRSEYRRFAEVCAFELDSSKFFYQDHITDRYYRWGYARIRRKDSEFTRLGQEHLKMKTGIFLDIFPIDGVPETVLGRSVHSCYCYALRKVLYSEVGRKTARTKIARACYSILRFVPTAFAHNQLTWLSRLCLKSRHVRINSFPLPRDRTAGYPRSWFEEVERIQFEKHLFSAIKEKHEYLMYTYDDYLQLPPPDQQKNSHIASKFRLPKVIQ